jgi:hypothetical protein
MPETLKAEPSSPQPPERRSFGIADVVTHCYLVVASAYAHGRPEGISQG